LLFVVYCLPLNIFPPLQPVPIVSSVSGAIVLSSTGDERLASWFISGSVAEQRLQHQHVV
jgi:hypothetical protein